MNSCRNAIEALHASAAFIKSRQTPTPASCVHENLIWTDLRSGQEGSPGIEWLAAAQLPDGIPPLPQHQCLTHKNSPRRICGNLRGHTTKTDWELSLSGSRCSAQVASVHPSLLAVGDRCHLRLRRVSCRPLTTLISEGDSTPIQMLGMLEQALNRGNEDGHHGLWASGDKVHNLDRRDVTTL